ncbi:MAG: hypothetical protein R2780_12375 [Crocinitomicaceae bacterium]|nr:hypothetical protein [Crocinitomicaceae bacterium]
MKKLLLVGIVSTAVLSLTACNKNNGCPNSSEKATIRDFTDSDSCGILFQLEDGTKLEATNLSEFPAINYEEGQLVWVKYKPASGASTCGLGEIVRLKCVSEREY